MVKKNIWIPAYCMQGFGKSDLKKASGSLSKTYRDCREKAENAQKGQKNDQKVLYLAANSPF